MKQSTPRLATAAGVLFLCVGSIVAWHRMGAVAGSEAHSRPIETGPTAAIESTPLSTSALRKTSVVENSSAIGAARSKAAGNQESALTAPILPRGPAVDIIKPTAEVASIASVPERQPHIQNVSPTATVTMAESEIQATRPPLHSVYPDFSGVEARGVVALTAEVDSDGVVRSVRVVRGNRALAAASVRAVRQWRYAPHFEDGKPVATETNIVISAFSDDAISMSFPPSISVSP